MSTIDLSRQATDPRKRYAGVRMQQGRVLTDDDFNEAAALDAEDMRRTRVHAIGAYGTPDAGFLPTNLGVTAGRLDFTLSTGTLYLGGLRLEMHAAERYLLQRDWLNFNPASAPTPPAAGQARTDLVWLEAWQQPVTAVEDSELFEVALGGPDTSTRWRTMRRVHVTPGVGATECGDAWTQVAGGFGALGTMNAEMELATNARLSVTFTAPPATGDLCSPAQAGGYLGAENQAIRVQMVSGTHYTWGYDNAAPLYRVQASVRNGQMVVLTLQNQPKDAVHWPLRDQVVEILPWSAALANGERVAELQGHLSRVAVSYNPDDQTLEITTPLPAGFGTLWQSRSDVADFFDGSPEQNFFYMRVWNRGDDLLSPPAIPIGTPVLGNTGLSVAFSGTLRAADHWIIAARPAAPEEVVPWQLRLPAGAPPAGLRRYRAPIALIEWTNVGGVVTGTVISDCRPPFLPLTRIRGCCNVTVGDGTHSFGMYGSIQAAIDALPPTGGTVCVLPGRYVEAVRLVGQRNITLHGCGPRSRIVAPAQQGVSSTAVFIGDSTDIEIESLALEGGNGPVIEARGSTVVRIEECLVQFRDNPQVFSPWPAIFIDGSAVEIDGNIIEPLPEELHRVFQHTAESVRAPQADAARGGIQLAGGCEQVRIAGNVIVGGAGNGITLGSILRIDSSNPGGIDLPDIDLVDPCAPCDPADVGPPEDDPSGTVRYESAGDLYDIEILRNDILRHGANGISVVRFFGLPQQGGVILVTVHGLSIADNRIVACLRRLVAQAPMAVQLMLGYGGVSLAFVTGLEIEGNLIADNGRDWLSPVCGVFALAAQGLRIEHNRIRANGARNTEPPDAAQPGIRAGVHIWLALSDAPGSAPAGNQTQPSLTAAVGRRVRQAGQIRVHANQIEQPLGRALFLLGAGPMLITDNRLLSEGGGARVTDPLATTVLVANFGFSREWTIGLLYVFVLLLYYRFFGSSDTPPSLCTYARLARFTPGLWPQPSTGKLMFNDNQVSFMMRDAPRGLDLSSTLLFSLDDVAVNDNQFEYHTELRVVLADLLVLAGTVRSNDNRLAETWGRAVRSLISFAIMNTCSDNQSTHCLAAYGLRRAFYHNLVLAEAFCPDSCGDQDALFGQIALGGQMATMPG